MAVVAELEAIITADTSGFDAGVSKANSELQDLGKGAGKAGDELGSAANQARKVGVALGAAGAAIGVPIAKAAQAASQLDTNMAAVNSILHLSDDALAGLTEQVVQMSKDVGKGPAELSDALYDIVSSGFQGQDALDVLRQSAKAATAGMTDTKTAAKALDAVLNSGISSLDAYGGSTMDVQKASDVLFQTVADGVLTFPELANNLGKTLPPAKNLGITLEELGAGYAELTLQGHSASASETELAALMTKMVNPTEDLSQAIHDQGYESAQAVIADKGMVGMLDLMNKAAGGSTEKLFDLAGSQEAFNALLVLGADGGKDYIDELNKMQHASDGVGATEGARTEVMKGAAAATARLAAASEVLGDRIGKDVAENTKEAKNRLADFLFTLSDTNPALLGTIGVLGAAASGILGLGSGAAFGAAGVLQLGKAMGLTMPQVLGFAKGLGLVGLAIGAGLLAYETNFLGFRDFVDAKLADAGQALNDFGFAFDDAFNSNRLNGMNDLAAAVGAFGVALDTALGTDISPTTRRMAEALQKFGDQFERSRQLALDSGMGELAADIMGVGHAIDTALGPQSNVSPTFDKIAAAAQAMNDSMTATEGTMPQLNRELSALQAGAESLTGLDVTGFFDDLGANAAHAQDDLTALKNNLEARDWAAIGLQMQEGASPAFSKFFDQFGAMTRDASQGFGDFINDLTNADWEKVAQDFGGGFDAIGKKFADFDIRGKLQPINDQLNAWFNDMGRDLMGGFDSMAGPGEREVTGMIPQLADNIVSGLGGLKDLVGSKLGEIGNPLEGVKQWLQDGLDEINRFFQPQELSAGLGGAGVGDTSGIQQMFDGMLQGISDAIPTADDVGALLKEKGEGFFQAIGNNLLGPLGQLIFPSTDAAAAELNASKMGEQMGTNLANALKDPAFATSLQDSIKTLPPETFTATGAALLGAITTGMLTSMTTVPEGAMEGTKTAGQNMVSTLASGLETSLLEDATTQTFIPVANALGSQLNAALGQAMTQTLTADKTATGPVMGQAAGGIGAQMVQSLATGLTDSITAADPTLFQPVAGALGTQIGTALSTAMAPQQLSGPSGIGGIPTTIQTPGIGDAMVTGLATGLTDSITAAKPEIFAPVGQALSGQLATALQTAMTQAPSTQFEGGGMTGTGDTTQTAGLGQQMVNSLATGLTDSITAAKPEVFSPVGFALGQKLDTALQFAMAAAPSSLLPGGGMTGTGGPPAGGLGVQMLGTIATGLTDSITAAKPETFQPVASALGSKLNEALQTVMTETAVGQQTGPVLGEAAGGVGGQMLQTLATGLTSSITDAPPEIFAPVGQAIGTQLSTALQTAVQATPQAGLGGTGADAEGVGAQMGQAVSDALVSGVTQADFAPVGTAVGSKLNEAVGQAFQGGGIQGGPSAVGDIGQQMGQQISSALAEAVSGADFSGLTSNLGSKLKEALSQAVEEASSGIEESIGKISESISTALSDISTTISTAVSDVDSAVNDLAASVTGATQNVTSAVATMQSAVETASSAMETAAQSAITAINDMGTAASTAASAVSSAMSTIASAIESAAGAAEAAAGRIVAALNTIAGAAADAAAAVNSVGSIPTPSGGGGGGGGGAPVTNASLDTGQATVTAFSNGMDQNQSLVKKSAQNLGQVAITALADEIQMGSPAKAFIPHGRAIADGMMQGMLDQAKSRLQSAIGKMAGAVSSAMGKVKSAMSSAMDRLHQQGQQQASDAGAAAATGAADGMTSEDDKAERAARKLWHRALKELLKGSGAARFLGEDWARNFWEGMLDSSGTLEFAQFVTQQMVAAAEDAVHAALAAVKGLGTQMDIVQGTIDSLTSDIEGLQQQLDQMDAQAAAADQQAKLQAIRDQLSAQQAITRELQSQFQTEFAALHQAHLRAVQTKSAADQAKYEAAFRVALAQSSAITESQMKEQVLQQSLDAMLKMIADAAAAELALRRQEIVDELALKKAQLEQEKALQQQLALQQHQAQVDYTNAVIEGSQKRLDHLQKELQATNDPQRKAEIKAQIKLEQNRINLAQQMAAALDQQLAAGDDPNALAAVNAQIQFLTEEIQALADVDVSAMLQTIVSELGGAATALSGAASDLGTAAAALGDTSATSGMEDTAQAVSDVGTAASGSAGGMRDMATEYNKVMAQMNADSVAFNEMFKAMVAKTQGDAAAGGEAIGTALGDGIKKNIEAGGPALQTQMTNVLSGAIDPATGEATKGGNSVADAFGSALRDKFDTQLPGAYQTIKDQLNGVVDATKTDASQGGKDVADKYSTEMSQKLTDKSDGMKNDIARPVNQGMNDAQQAASDGGINVGGKMADGIQKGVNDKAKDIAKTAADMVRDAIKAAHDAAGNASPSKKMQEVGDLMGLGLIYGLEGRHDDAEKASAGLVAMPKLSPTSDGGVSGNRAGSGGGTTVYIEHLELPNVKEPEDFIREMNTFAQMTGVASGRG